MYKQVFVTLPQFNDSSRNLGAYNEQAGILECGFGDSDMIVGSEINSFGQVDKKGLLI